MLFSPLLEVEGDVEDEAEGDAELRHHVDVVGRVGRFHSEPGLPVQHF